MKLNSLLSLPKMSGHVNQGDVLLRAETEMSYHKCITFVIWEVTVL